MFGSLWRWFWWSGASAAVAPAVPTHAALTWDEPARPLAWDAPAPAALAWDAPARAALAWDAPAPGLTWDEPARTLTWDEA